MSYQRAWSTFTLKTLVGTFIFWRREAVKPCSSANGSLTPGQLKKPYARTLTQHQSGALSHVKSGCIQALMAPFVAIKRDCANFSQASHCEEMYCDSTGDMACSLTLAKTSESLAKKGGQTPPPPLQPTNSIRGDITHTGVLSNTSTASNTQGPFDSAKRETSQLN